MKRNAISFAILAMLAACGGGDPDVRDQPMATPVEGRVQPLLPLDLQPVPAPATH